MLKKINKSDVDLKRYKAQSMVRRHTTSEKFSYDRIAIMTDSDADG